MSALPKHRLSEAEYLEIERAAEYRSEYIAGEMYAMAGTSRRHSRILLNAASSLHGQLRGRPCEAHVTEFRVRVAESGLYTYPDIVALCGEPQLLDGYADTLLNPQLIVEVLSPSTERYDRGAKFGHYRNLESLTDYVLIAQDKMLVEHWTRETRDHWVVHYFANAADRVRFQTLNAEILLGDIYENVEFSEESPADIR